MNIFLWNNLAPVEFFMGKICTTYHPLGYKIFYAGEYISQAAKKIFYRAADNSTLIFHPTVL